MMPKHESQLDLLYRRLQIEHGSYQVEGAIRDMLSGRGENAPPLWARFDPTWYRRTYPVAFDAADPLDFYLSEGMSLGHSPNVFFDEAWYVAQYSDVEAAIAAGEFRSGFEHYCRSGYATFAPHWLFDPGYYREKYTDLTPDSPAGVGFVNLYDHYLASGSREGRTGHLLFSPDLYRLYMIEQLGPAAALEACPFEHYLHSIEESHTEIPTTIYFDHEWYFLNYPLAEKLINSKKYKCALHHYLANDEPIKFDALGYFKEHYYLERYADVEAVVGKGRWFRNGYMHFLRYGQQELRNPTPQINMQFYWARSSNVVVDAELARISDPFAHLLDIGLLKGLPFAPAGNPVDVPEKQARALFLAHAENTVPLYAKRPLDFRVANSPDVSVIVVIHNHLAMTLMALASLRDNYPSGLQLILVDSGSTDEARSIERYVRGAVYLRLETNVGFVHACNCALLHVQAPAVLFMNNDVRLSPGAISSALSRLESAAAIGAVGAKVIRTNEKLQEAGCIIWGNGRTTGYMRDWSPLCPEVNFCRDIDFASGVFLLARTKVVTELGGFDPRFAPAYYEDADLCLRMWNAGYRVVYDPNVVVYHYEYGSSRESGSAFAMMQRNEKAFLAKHHQNLKGRSACSPEAIVNARFAGKRLPRILYIEDYVPLRALGAGAVRSNDIIRILAESGYQLTVFPVHGTTAPLSEIYADFHDNVEVMHDLTYHDLRRFLSERRDYFDCIWICRAHNLNLLKPVLEQVNIDAQKTPVILDTEAVFSFREALQARRGGKKFDLKLAMKREFEHAAFCQKIVTVSSAEATALRKFGLKNTVVVGTYRPVCLTPSPWKSRSGLLFVGSLYASDTPNFDSLCWFIEEILPLVEEELGWETRLNIVGHRAAGVALDRFNGHTRVTWHGPVVDLEKTYDAHRVVIAPTRFAAGTPYKIYEAASYGVPAVVTDLLAGQLGWKSEKELLSAPVDRAAEFAAHVVRLYRSENLWNTIRANAARRLEEKHGRDAYQRALIEIMPAS